MDIFYLYCQLVSEWVPGHVGTCGNAIVDLAAKCALKNTVSKRLAVPYSDHTVLTKSLWQMEWDRYPDNKLHKIQPKMDDSLPSCACSRLEENLFCHLYIGHTFLTCFCLLKGDVFIPCNVLLLNIFLPKVWIDWNTKVVCLMCVLESCCSVSVLWATLFSF